MKGLSLTAILASLLVVGCDLGTRSSEGPVAIIDLNVIAQKLGKDKQILQSIEKHQANLNEQLSATQNSLLQQLQQKKNEFGDLSDEESKHLLQLQNQANTILANTRSQAQSNLTEFQLNAVHRFREEMRSVVMELAAKKGCRVVLSKNDSVVFAFASTVDLTDEVVSCLQSKGSVSTTTSTVSGATQGPVKQASTQPPATSKK